MPEIRDSFAAGDAAGEQIEAILALIPVDDWAFALLRPNGDLQEVVSPGGMVPAAPERPAGRRLAAGPRLEPIAEPVAPYAAGLTLVFADQRMEFATLTLLRSAGRAPFSSAELRVLRIALDTISHSLSRLRLMQKNVPDPADLAHARSLCERTAETVLYVLDRDFEVVLGPPPRAGDEALPPAPFAVERRLPPFLESAVRELVKDWGETPAPGQQAIVAHPAPFLTLRVEPLCGATVGFIGVHVQEFAERDPLTRAASSYAITPREAQTLALLMEGLHIVEIAERLAISPSTIQDHIKNLLEKTGTYNRVAMVARVLGWRHGSAEAMRRRLLA